MRIQFYSKTDSSGRWIHIMQVGLRRPVRFTGSPWQLAAMRKIIVSAMKKLRGQDRKVWLRQIAETFAHGAPQTAGCMDHPHRHA